MKRIRRHRHPGLGLRIVADDARERRGERHQAAQRRVCDRHANRRHGRGRELLHSRRDAAAAEHGGRTRLERDPRRSRTVVPGARSLAGRCSFSFCSSPGAITNLGCRLGRLLRRSPLARSLLCDRLDLPRADLPCHGREPSTSAACSRCSCGRSARGRRLAGTRSARARGRCSERHRSQRSGLDRARPARPARAR